MKAIRVKKFGEPEVMRFEEMPSLEPAADQILVEIKAAGVNPVDTYIRSGNYNSNPVLPYTPGFDGAGIVRAVGKRVRKVKPGQRVYLADSLTGTYAEQALCSEDHAFPLPANVSFEQGAGIYVAYTTAYFSLFSKAKAQKGETVLIHGASGGVGIGAVQLAKAAGLRVMGTAGSEEGLRLAKQHGADHVFNHNSLDYVNEILAATDRKGVDIILEMLANVNLSKDLDVLASRGRVMVIGCRGPVEINPRRLMQQDAWIHGISLFHLTREEKNQIQHALYKGFTNGKLSVVVGTEFPLTQASEAHRKVMSAVAYGKVILRI